MKIILSEAINGIDWDTPESMNYLMHTKGNHESFFIENILLYLTQVKQLNFYSKKLIDGVRKQKVDLIEQNDSIESNHFIVDQESKTQIPVARLVDFGMNNVLQPAEYNINKSLSDIKRRTLTQGLKNEYYTVQAVLNIHKLQKINTEEQENDIKAKLKQIDKDYSTLDPNHEKIKLQMKQGENRIDAYFYICGSFSSDSWTDIKGLFKDYKTSKATSLSILND